MPRRVPKYRLHKPSGRAVVQWRPLFGKSPHYLPGAYNSPESLAAFAGVMRQIFGASGKPQEPPPKLLGRVTVGELLAAYARQIEPSATVDGMQKLKAACRPLYSLYAQSACDDFGPLKLQSVRDSMLDKGWSRSTINAHVNRLKRIFRWGAARELFQASVYGSLSVVENLKAGETTAKEPTPRKPVGEDAVERVFHFVVPMIEAMIRIQFLSGIRSGELCRLRPCEIDGSGDVWVYVPREHKTAHRGKEKIICFGPRARALLEPYLGSPQDFIFTPAKAIAEQNARRAASRKTKQYGVRKEPRTRRTQPRYTSRTYQKAINYGFIKLANSLGFPGRPGKGERIQNWLSGRGVTYWHPHLLRHTRATQTRAAYSVEGSAAQMGNTITATQIYAKQSLDLARRIARETG